MNKRLCVMGNSLGVIIDKPILRVLGIGKRSVLRVVTDGRRILIEPTGETLDPSQSSASLRELPSQAEAHTSADEGVSLHVLAFDAHAVFVELVRRWSISQDHVADLYHEGRPRIGRVGGWIEFLPPIEKLTEKEIATLRRLRRCRDRCREGDTWQQAIDDALRAFPREQSQRQTPPGPTTQATLAACGAENDVDDEAEAEELGGREHAPTIGRC